MKMEVTKTNKRLTVAALLVCAVILLNGRSSILSGERRLEANDVSYDVERAIEYYNMFLSEDVSEGLQDMQKMIRLKRKCEIPEKKKTEEEAEAEGSQFDTNHPDSHLTMISCVEAHYRIPESSIQNIEDSMVFGVISGGGGEERDQSRSRREAIRETWGKDSKVFFLVSGPWWDNEEEYNQYKDMLWVDQPEEKLAHPTNGNKGALPFKTETFMIAMFENVMEKNPNVKYFFKTDDDCYVDTNQLKKEISSAGEGKRIDYGGQCIDNKKPNRDEWQEDYTPYFSYPYNYFPTYCTGSGYVMSRYFLECAVSQGHIERTVYVRSEPVTVGLLAEKCGFEPVLDLFSIFEEKNEEYKLVAIQDNVRTPDEISALHSIVNSQ
jgi:hypothetical protein